MTNIKSSQKYSSRGLFHKQQMALYFSQKRRRLLATGGVVAAPDIIISGQTVFEDAPIGTTVGALSVTNGAGIYVFTLLDDAGGLFAIDGDDVEVAGALDFETAEFHNIEVNADNGVDPPIQRIFTITVINVSEIPTDGELDFSNIDQSGLLALFEDI